MDGESIRQALASAVQAELGSIEFFPVIDSTNAEALRRLRAGYDKSSLLVAGKQQAGRGRRGRTWLSPEGQGIYMSLTLTFHEPVDRLQCLSLLAAISLHSGISGLGAEGLGLKWPNDVYHNKRKLAGILLELHRSGRRNHVVFGIGVNVALQRETALAVGQPVTDLHSVLAPLPAGELIIAAVIDELFRNLAEFKTKGFGAFTEKWNSCDCFVGRRVELVNGRRNVSGRSLGVDKSGALRLDTAEGIRIFSGGEVMPSLRAREMEADR